MATPINFRGLNHYATGNATLRSEKDGMILEGFKNSFDGITIETNGAKQWELTFNPVEIKKDDVFGISYNVLDGLKRVKTVAQYAITYSPDGKYAYLAVNSRLEGDKIELVGMKDGKEVMKEVYDKPEDLDCNWIVVAILVLAAVSVVASNVDYENERTVVTHPNGTKTVTVRTKKSFGGGGVVQPVAKAAGTNPEPGKGEFPFDHLYITSERCYTEDSVEELDGNISQVIFTPKVSEQIFITDEVYKM